MGWGNCFLLQIMLLALSVLYYSDAITTLNQINELAKTLDRVMDHSKDPCENFYDYVCANWNETFPRPSHYNVWNMHHLSQEIITHKIRTILEDRNNNLHKQLLLKERVYYDACMDVDYSMEKGEQLYEHMIKESKKAGPDWQDVAEYYADKIGEISFFHVTLGLENELEIIRPSHTKSNKEPFTVISEDIDNYLDKMSSYLRLFQKESITSSFKQHFKNFVELISWQVRKPELPLLPVTIGQLQELYDESCPFLNSTTKINWLRFFKKLAGPSGAILTNLHNIYVDWSYIRTLCAVLSSASNDVIVRYLRFNFEEDENVMFYVDKKLKKMNNLERSYNCIVKMPLSTGYSNILTSEDKLPKKLSFLSNMLTKLKTELRSQILDSWFETGLKFQAVTVVNKIKLWLSNMHFPITKREIESIAYNFDVTPISLENLINFKKAQTVYKFSLFSVGKKSVRTKRDIKMNAFYMYQKNIMVISPAFLFPPFFHDKAPRAFNFGRLGRVIGHEISHAFDYTRIQPKFGYHAVNKKQHELGIAYKLICFANQFDQLKEGSGMNTVIENIADTQGLKLAFKAMRRHIETHPETADERLENFQDFDANKLFFIAFANDLCESRKYKFFGRTHSAARDRVTGTLQNMEEFAEAFNCAKGRPMNPVGEKCDYWGI